MKRLLFFVALTGCQHPSSLTPVAPATAEDSTYKMLTGNALGTAWAASDHYLITAGHMCDETDKYALVSSLGERFGATLVDYSQTYREDDTAPVVPDDICLIKTDRTLTSYLPLAGDMPSVGDAVYYVGYPKGEWAKSYGVYEGDLDDEHWNDYSFSAPCDHGASGSAVLDASGHVWGVLVRVKVVDGEARPGVEGCVASPLSQIISILNNA